MITAPSELPFLVLMVYINNNYNEFQFSRLKNRLMKTKLLIMLFFVTQLLPAQNFTEKAGTMFENVSYSSIEFADVDGDNDEDVIVAGFYTFNPYQTASTKLYMNDGMGNYVEKDSPLVGIARGDIKFFDADGDNDLDVIIAGEHQFLDRTTRLYLNDGAGNFTEKMGTPFEGVVYCSIAIADIDNDNDLDVFIIGKEPWFSYAWLYRNDGSGNFVKVTAPPMEGLSFSSAAFADIDGDNDQDLFITGRKYHNTQPHMAILYSNDGFGNFSVLTDTTFKALAYSSVEFADVDGDNDLDLLTTGAHYSTIHTILYLNDGLGRFTEKTGTTFDDVAYSSIKFKDMDGDNDPDVLIAGSTSSGLRSTKLYMNDGAGNFSELPGTPFEGIDQCAVGIADINGDNDYDILISGNAINYNLVVKLYVNDLLSFNEAATEENEDLVIVLYPNPTSDKINVHYSSETGHPVLMNIIDLTGKLVSQKKVKSEVGDNLFSFDLSTLVKGIYFLQIEDGMKIGTRQFIVN